MTDKQKKSYGWVRDQKDDRDKKVVFTEEHVARFSKVHNKKSGDIFDLRTIVKLPEVLDEIDQQNLGSCTSNAIAFAYAFDEVKQNNSEQFMPSRLFIYYNERMMEGTVSEDSGAQIRDGIKSINKYGVCDEHHWVYDPSKFAVKPPAEVYAEAKLAKSVAYASIDFSSDRSASGRTAHLKKSLQSGYPFVFGFTVYESFESEQVAETGMMPMPQPGEQILGGHAVCCIGFDDTKQSFIVKNSWGSSWGVHGYFYMPYAFMSDEQYTSDFWVVQQVTNPNNIPNFSPGDIAPDAVNN